MKLFRYFILAVVTLALSLSCTTSRAGTLATPYTDKAQFTSIPFAHHSHWLQPWRAYMETVPATTFLNGTGINWRQMSGSENPELVAQMLAKHGIRRARVPITWSNIDFSNEKQLIPQRANQFRAILLALKKHGIRPLILLNANHGVPCPVEFVERTLAADARAGDTKVQLNDTSKLIVGYSGLSNLTDYWAAESLITNISGNTITLSKPLPEDIKAGTPVSLATLKYRPFSVPGSDDYRATMAGWQSYVGTVANFVADVLGTSQSSNKGFDMEIWNELSFGTHFLYINEYYAQKPYDYDKNSILINLIKETSAYVEAHSTDFQGVQLTNGFGTTIPWTASSHLPERFTAISKHPYPKRRNFPQDQKRNTPVNALGKKDQSGFIPTYSTLIPEYHATAIPDANANLVRDLAPITSDVYGTKHGRYARVIDGKVVPTPIWITEVNIDPEEHVPNITTERALAVKAKTTARYLSFFLNKGATQVHLFAAGGGDKEYGIVKQSFLDYAKQSAVYPTNDTAYTSPALATLDRIVAKMREKVDQNLKSTRPLEVVSISDTHNHYQFKGDGTAAHPNLYNRDVFAFLPYQVNAKRFVIPYYVMTRDIMKDLNPEKFTVEIKGVKGSNASVTAYDPINDKTVPVTVKKKGADSLSLELTATDYPYLLTIQEA